VSFKTLRLFACVANFARVVEPVRFSLTALGYGWARLAYSEPALVFRYGPGTRGGL